MKKTAFFIVILFAFSACERFFNQVVEIDPPAYDESLVFHQFISDQDSSIRLLLTRNYGIFDNIKNQEQWYVRGANVEWWQNGQRVTTLQALSVDSGYVYTAPLPAPPQAGQEYEIRVSHPDFNAVKAIQKMPDPVPAIQNFKVTPSVVIDQFGQSLDEIEITFTDPAGVNNYYEFALGGIYSYLQWIGNDPDGNPLFDTIQTPLYPIYFENTFDPNIVEGVAQSTLLTDRFFDGQTYTFRAQYFSVSNDIGGLPAKLFFTVRNATPEYFFWSKSYYQQYNNQSNPFAEPTSVYNNLENGLGIFGMYTERRIVVQ